MNNNELLAGTKDEQRPDADSNSSASVEASPMLSAALSVKEGNKLIAEFMQGEPEQWYPENKDINSTGIHYCFPKDNYPANEKYVGEYALKYHSSWDWLMPVVEKIEMLHWNDRNNQFNPQLEFFLQNEIEFVWNHVVKFLKWYNLNAVPVGSR